MPSVSVKLYSVFFKFLLKQRLQNRFQTPVEESNRPFGVTSRPEESFVAANPSFNDGVATKDIHIDSSTSLTIRIFLPESALTPSEPDAKLKPKLRTMNLKRLYLLDSVEQNLLRRNSYGPSAIPNEEPPKANSIGSYSNEIEGLNLMSGGGGSGGVYRGYLPSTKKCRKMPVMLQFHGGGWVSGSNDSAANDSFCRRIAKLCDVIVVAVGYRLSPEDRYPAAFEDGFKVLNWLGRQANLAECSNWTGNNAWDHENFKFKKPEPHRQIVDAFGSSVVEPWLAAHGDPSRCVLLGVSCGANIANFVAQKAMEAGKHLDPIKIVAQVLMCPFFIGTIPTHSELILANSYFYEKAMCILAWKLFLSEEEFSLDHPAANPLIPGQNLVLNLMPPTLTVVAELDWMRDRAIAYSEELRKASVDSSFLVYKDAVHEFATLDMLLKTPQAQTCAEDIAIWLKKYISIQGHESYLTMRDKSISR